MLDLAVIYSFCPYVLYVLLPLIPALLIFKLFPDTKVTVAGPLQNLTINATGAFAAYVVTVALGFFIVQDVVTQINSSRHYAVEGVIGNLGEKEGFNSNQFYSRYAIASSLADGSVASRDYYFVLLLDHPVLKPETVWLDYWGDNGPSGFGQLPYKHVPIELSPTPVQQRFRLDNHDGQVSVVSEALAHPVSASRR